jgi:type II secretory pathway component GspD/PulD (secretin)
MIRTYSIAMALVCLFAVSASAQDAKPVTRPVERTIILDISMVEVNLNRTEELERLAKDKARLDSLIAEGKARPVASLQMRTRSGESATARVGQRVPIQTGALPLYNAPTDRQRRIQNQQPGVDSGDVMVTSTGLFPGVGVPLIQYENTGLQVDASPNIIANDQVEVRLKIEMTGVDKSTGNLTPTFIQRNVSDIVRVRQGETALLMGLVQHEALWTSQAQSSRPQSSDQSRGSFVVLLTARVLD